MLCITVHATMAHNQLLLGSAGCIARLSCWHRHSLCHQLPALINAQHLGTTLVNEVTRHTWWAAAQQPQQPEDSQQASHIKVSPQNALPCCSALTRSLNCTADSRSVFNNNIASHLQTVCYQKLHIAVCICAATAHYCVTNAMCAAAGTACFLTIG